MLFDQISIRKAYIRCQFELICRVAFIDAFTIEA